MAATDHQIRGEVQRMMLVPACLCIVLAIWCLAEVRTLSSRRDSYRTLIGQIEQMDADAARIEVLRTAPRLATDRVRPNDELLDEVRRAAVLAGLPVSHWTGSDPSAPVRIPHSSYKRLSVRLSFVNVTLQQLAAFSHHLTSIDSAISVSGIRLSANRKDDGHLWDAELTISYPIYSPAKKTHP